MYLRRTSEKVGSGIQVRIEKMPLSLKNMGLYYILEITLLVRDTHHHNESVLYEENVFVHACLCRICEIYSVVRSTSDFGWASCVRPAWSPTPSSRRRSISYCITSCFHLRLMMNDALYVRWPTASRSFAYCAVLRKMNLQYGKKDSMLKCLWRRWLTETARLVMAAASYVYPHLRRFPCRVAKKDDQGRGY